MNLLCFYVTFPLFLLDGKIFQEKVESLMYLRNSSSGGKSVDSSAFVVTTPTGFAALPLEGKTMLEKHIRTLRQFFVECLKVLLSHVFLTKPPTATITPSESDV